MIWVQINFRVRGYIFGFGPELISPFTTRDVEAEAESGSGGSG